MLRRSVPKRPDRAALAVWRTGLYNMIFLGSIGVFFFIFATPVVRLFVDDPTVVPIAALALRTMSCGNVGYAYGMVMLQAFNGAGDTFTPSVINLICYWVVQLPLAYLLGRHYQMGPNGIYTAILAAEILLSSISIYVFRQGRWKQKVV